MLTTPLIVQCTYLPLKSFMEYYKYYLELSPKIWKLERVNISSHEYSCKFEDK